MSIDPHLPPDPAIRAIWQDYVDRTGAERDAYNSAIQAAYADRDRMMTDADHDRQVIADRVHQMLEQRLTDAWHAYWAGTELARQSRERATDEAVRAKVARPADYLPAPVSGPPHPPMPSSTGRVPPYVPPGPPAASASPPGPADPYAVRGG